jgi:hypothetical protein
MLATKSNELRLDSDEVCAWQWVITSPREVIPQVVFCTDELTEGPAVVV